MSDNTASSHDDDQEFIEAIHAEYPGFEPDTFCVNDINSATWVVRQIKSQRQRAQDAAAYAEAEIRDSQRAEQFFVKRYGKQLEDWLRVNMKGKAKSVKLPAGVIGYRQKPASVEPVPTRQADYFGWVKRCLPQALKVKVKLDLTGVPQDTIDSVLATIEGMTERKPEVDESIAKSLVNDHWKTSGELPDGCDLIPEKDEFYVKT